MQRSKRRGTRRSKVIQNSRVQSKQGGWVPVLIVVGIFIVAALYYLASKGPTGEASPKKEEETVKESVPAAVSEEEKQEIPEAPVRKTYFTEAEWYEVRKKADNAIKLMHKVRLQYEDGTIDQDERIRKNREVDKLFDEAYQAGMKLLRRVPEKDEPRYEGYGSEMRSWLLKKRRLIK